MSILPAEKGKGLRCVGLGTADGASLTLDPPLMLSGQLLSLPLFILRERGCGRHSVAVAVAGGSHTCLILPGQLPVAPASSFSRPKASHGSLPGLRCRQPLLVKAADEC